MIRFLTAFDATVGKVLNAIVLVSSLLIVGLMLFLVLGRYVFGWSVVGTLELVMLFGMWLYMMGALIASRKNEHLVVDFLEQQIVDARLQAIHRALIAAITLVICLFFIYWSYRMLAWGLRRPQTTPALSIPLYVPQAAIMLTSIGCLLYALRDLVMNLLAIRAPAYAEER